MVRGIHADAIAKMEWEDEWTGNTKRDKAPEPVRVEEWGRCG